MNTENKMKSLSIASFGSPKSFWYFCEQKYKGIVGIENEIVLKGIT